VLTTLSFSGCSPKRPFDKPEFKEIGSNETAFIVPLTGSTDKQAGFMSEKYLQDNKVATKRIPIPHEWVQDGKKANNGHYQATIQVIIVNRTPYSVTWTKYKNGQDGDLDARRIPVESTESIGFTIPISVTAMISEEDAAKFLNKYTEKRSLADVVDTDVNAYIKTKSSERPVQSSEDYHPWKGIRRCKGVLRPVRYYPDPIRYD